MPSKYESPADRRARERRERFRQTGSNSRNDTSASTDGSWGGYESGGSSSSSSDSGSSCGGGGE